MKVVDNPHESEVYSGIHVAIEDAIYRRENCIILLLKKRMALSYSSSCTTNMRRCEWYLFEKIMGKKAKVCFLVSECEGQVKTQFGQLLKVFGIVSLHLIV